MSSEPSGGRRGRSKRGWIVVGIAAVVFVALVAIAQMQRDDNQQVVSAPVTSPTTSTVPSTQTSTTPESTAPGSTPAASESTAATTTTVAAAEPGAATPIGPQGDELFVVRRDPSDTLARGRVDAPVVLVEWVDTRCPFCALFSRNTLPTLIEEYVDAGLVRYELRLIEFFGEQSRDAAVAVHAAGEQGLGLEYMEVLYAAAPDKGHPELTRDVLLGFAEQVAIPDLDRFRADLDREDLRAIIADQSIEAARLGVKSVPFFLVGRQAVAGAQPIDVFRKFLDEAIAKAPN